MHSILGETLKQLRQQSGYSQKELAALLNVTDKAVSKWECGKSCPDISLLPRISVLLDSDIEPILKGFYINYGKNWKGVIDLSSLSIPISSFLYDKPFFFYLVSIYELVGIKDVEIISSNEDFELIARMNEWSKLGLNIVRIKEISQDKDIILMKTPCFLFAASLTRQLLAFMNTNSSIVQACLNNGEELPLFFIPRGCSISSIGMRNKVVRKIFSRGTIGIKINSFDAITDISHFVSFFQKYQNQKISDVSEISKKRQLVIE